MLVKRVVRVMIIIRLSLILCEDIEMKLGFGCFVEYGVVYVILYFLGCIGVGLVGLL